MVTGLRCGNQIQLVDGQRFTAGTLTWVCGPQLWLAGHMNAQIWRPLPVEPWRPGTWMAPQAVLHGLVQMGRLAPGADWAAERHGHWVRLSQVLSVSGLASLTGLAPEVVRAELADLLVITAEEEPPS